MPRILVAECKQEVSSFNPVPSHYQDFDVFVGQELFDYHRPVRDEVGGALSVLDTIPDADLVPTFGARAITSGGTLAAADYDRLASEFLSAIGKALQDGPSPDGIYFALHGAMSAENEDDPEGHLLEETRKLIGDDVPLVISLDLHGILTDRMLRLADAVVVYHTYPHVDFYETGVRAAKVLRRILLQGAKPVTARVAIPALVRGDELITATGSFGECIRYAEQLEQSDEAMSAGMFIGNPFTDVPELRTNSIVICDGDEDKAQQHALKLAETFWSHHEKMLVPLTDLETAVSRATEALTGDTPGATVLMDAADATSSGASGDSNAILRALVESGYEGSALIPIVDATAVDAAFAAGVGATIETTIGGNLDSRRYRPLEIKARVRMLSDGHFLSESFRQHWSSGRTAVLQVGHITLVVTSRAVSLYDRALFYAHGQEPKDFDLVVVKSPHCEPHMFAAWCGQLINVDAPGATSANLLSLGHTKAARPLFPLDENVTFTPQATVFSRSRDCGGGTP